MGLNWNLVLAPNYYSSSIDRELALTLKVRAQYTANNGISTEPFRLSRVCLLLSTTSTREPLHCLLDMKSLTILQIIEIIYRQALKTCTYLCRWTAFQVSYPCHH